MPRRGKVVGFGAVVALLLSVLAAGLLRSAPAAAHDEVPGATTVFDRADPALPATVEVDVVRSAADELLIVNRSPEDLEVLADTGEAFVRIGPSGTFANLASPTWYAVQLPEPSAATPPPGVAAGASTPPRWEKVRDGAAYSWFDHRLHPSPIATPPAAEPGVLVRLDEWRVPIRLGGRPIELLGHRQFTRLAGSVVASIDQTRLQGSDLVVSVASGRVPAMVLDATGAVKAAPVVVLGEGGEPMLRLTGDGVEANLASPTWALTAAARGDVTGARSTADPPRWQRIAVGPTVTWLEPRAAYQLGVPEEGVQRSPDPVVLGSWTVPVEVGGRRLNLEGVTTWVPDGALVAEEEGRGGWVVPVAAGTIVAALLASTALLVHRGRRQVRAGRPGAHRGS